MKKIAEFAEFMGKSELEMAIELNTRGVPMNLKTGEYDETKILFEFSVIGDSIGKAPVALTVPVTAYKPTLPPDMSEMRERAYSPRRMLKGDERQKSVIAIGDTLLHNGIYLEMYNPDSPRSCRCFISTDTHPNKIPAILTLTNSYNVRSPNLFKQVADRAHFTLHRPREKHMWVWCFMYAARWGTTYMIRDTDYVWEEQCVYGAKVIYRRDIELEVAARAKEIG
jgi:hypothetical protein